MDFSQGRAHSARDISFSVLVGWGRSGGTLQRGSWGHGKTEEGWRVRQVLLSLPALGSWFGPTDLGHLAFSSLSFPSPVMKATALPPIPVPGKDTKMSNKI